MALIISIEPSMSFSVEILPVGQVVFARYCPSNGDVEPLVIFVNPVGHLVRRKKS